MFLGLNLVFMSRFRFRFKFSLMPRLPADHWDWYERIRTYFSEYAEEQEAGRAHSEARQEARNLRSQPVRLLMELAGL